MQKLILPFKRQMMLCGYKNAEYQKHWGYPHYGVDISTIQGGAGDDPTAYASGDGVVLLAGRDARLGWAVCVMYSGAYNHKTGKTVDVAARYMHLEEIFVSTGTAVKRGDKLGREGKEGTGDYHLHIELDTDLKYPQYSPQVAGSDFWKKGTDSTLNPSHLFHVGVGQMLVTPTYNPAWLNEEDFNIPVLVEEEDELTRLKKAVTEYEVERASIYNLAKQIIDIIEGGR